MRIRLFHIAIMAVGLAAVPRLAISQETPAKQTTDGNAKVSQLASPAPKHYYKLSFVLRERDEGKVLNQRAFTMNIAADPPQAEKPTWWNLRSGTRVPIPDTKGGTNYVDVGVNLDVRAFEVADGLELEVTSEISSVGTESGNTAPPIRQVKVRSAVMAAAGKPTVIFTADDPASQHRFELEVTPARER
jgi:hypothetical protein